jgi:signal transduction histidine kinase
VPPSRRSRPAADAVFPEALGVGLVATLVVGLVAISILACFTLGHQGWRAQRAEGQALTEVFAAAAGHVADRDEAEIHAVFHQLGAAHQALRVAEWIGPDGQVRCRWPGTVAGQPGGAPAATAQAEATTAGTVSFTAPVRSGTNTPAGTLALTFAFSDRPQPTYLLLVGCAVIAIVTLLGYFALYRRLRRRLRPMDAIQRNLHDYAGGLEKEFVALSLSDSFGQVATGWNELIAQLTALRNQQGEAGPGDLEREALQRFETRTLRYMLDQLPIGILRFGREQRVTYANMAASRLLGHALEAVVGLPLTEAVEEEVGAALIGAYLRSVATTSIDRKRGAEEQQSTLRFALIPPPDSAPDSEALVMIEDVSHLQEADRARDNFLYHVTHELRTPLTNIQAYAETLTGPGFDDEQTRRECYNVIISETRRLSRLVENILNISQLEVGTARIELSEVDFVRLLRQIVQDHLGAADEKKIDLTLRLPPKVPKLRGDKQRLSVLMTNLIGNALKYTAEGGHVNVALEVHERCLRIAVADTGIGIAPEDQLHVFEKFYRAARDDVQTVTGTGLGLAIAREVARLHGGDIRLESQIAEGSKFVVELPRATGGS